MDTGSLRIDCITNIGSQLVKALTISIKENKVSEHKLLKNKRIIELPINLSMSLLSKLSKNMILVITIV